MSERFTTPDPDADDLPEEELPPSRSQRKRDSHAIQEAARRLLALSAAELAPLELSPATLAAVAETARIKDRRAMPRHVKRVANLLEREDLGAIEALLDSARPWSRPLLLVTTGSSAGATA